MVPRENIDQKAVVVDTPLRAPPSASKRNDHEVGVGFGILRALLQARLQQLLALISIGREKRRRKQSVKGNEDVRTPSTQDLDLDLGLHHPSEAL
jgi:hypothetical protein